MKTSLSEGDPFHFVGLKPVAQYLTIKGDRVFWMFFSCAVSHMSYTFYQGKQEDWIIKLSDELAFFL